jgi:hypothetical protein
MSEPLQEFVSRQNAAFLRKQLGDTADTLRRKMLLTLLAEDGAKRLAVGPTHRVA